MLGARLPQLLDSWRQTVYAYSPFHKAFRNSIIGRTEIQFPAECRFCGYRKVRWCEGVPS